MLKSILLSASTLALAGATYANYDTDIELQLEGALLLPKSTVGAFDNSAGGNPLRGSKVDQEMDSFESLKFSIIKPIYDQISIVGSIYSPAEVVMSPANVLAVVAVPPGTPRSDSYGVTGRVKMVLAQLGGEYTIPLSGNFHPFVGAGLAFAYFYNGGTNSMLNHGGHAIENFDINNTISGYISAGAKYHMSDNFSLTGSVTYMPLEMDAAYQFSTYVGNNPPITKEMARDELKLKINPVILTMGANWKF
ncbi:MAG: OmpW family outer membrane protein [Candidatus Endonucleobacter sp. (ex Gigantidas childressi)]|nr:OmpW family outer membrane protein [Candidatus Endonucleobacter sp. (ex Gigantidas childressi)]